MKIYEWAELDDGQKRNVLKRARQEENGNIRAAAQAIIDDVRARGDDAVLEYSRKFDRLASDDIRIPPITITRAIEEISEQARQAIDTAFDNIAAFHRQQGLRACAAETTPGVMCTRIVRPLNTVGLYVPGGSAPLVSTTLMLGIPAMIADCLNVFVCTPMRNGRIDPHILYAASKCGITQVFGIGGAQAIAAMAYGTATIPKADKIFGPGNAYVTAAKSLVSSDPAGCPLDMPAGPSEVLVIADHTTDPDFAAADLLAQAEHDPMSQTVLVATSRAIVDEIMQQVGIQLAALPRRDIAAAAMENSVAIIASDTTEAIAISNIYAPEHLILCFRGAAKLADLVANAGSVFIGPWATESAGDYTSGTNHVLPTYGYARNYSGLGVEAFQKTITFQSLTEDGLKALAPTIETLANLEGLDAHARAATIRTAKLP